MTRLHFHASTAGALFLALAFTPMGKAQTPTESCAPRALTSSSEQTYKIYSLDGMGKDAGFGAWIAETIPEVIAAGTWKGPGAIRYYAPKNILVVSHSPAVQAQVGAFLTDLKKATPIAKTARVAVRKSTARKNRVTPAAYQDPILLSRPPTAVPEANSSYPVPVQARTPKHLFHFIIRYEGEGIVDDNIVKAMKAYYKGENASQEAKAVEAKVTESEAKTPDRPAASLEVLTPPGKLSTAVKENDEKKEEAKDEKKEKKAEDRKDKEKKEEPSEEP